MRQVHWEYTCDWCGVARETDTQTMPDGMLLVLVGDDRKPNKWQQRKHVCEDCWNFERTLLNPKGKPYAPKD